MLALMYPGAHAVASGGVHHKHPQKPDFPGNKPPVFKKK